MSPAGSGIMRHPYSGGGRGLWRRVTSLKPLHVCIRLPHREPAANKHNLPGVRIIFLYTNIHTLSLTVFFISSVIIPPLKHEIAMSFSPFLRILVYASILPRVSPGRTGIRAYGRDKNRLLRWGEGGAFPEDISLLSKYLPSKGRGAGIPGRERSLNKAKEEGSAELCAGPVRSGIQEIKSGR